MVGQAYPCHPQQKTHPWQTLIPNSWTISGHVILRPLRNTTSFVKKEKNACFNSRNEKSHAIQNRCQEFALNNTVHVLQKVRLRRITWTSASWGAPSAEGWKAAAAGTRDNGGAASGARASRLGRSPCQPLAPSQSQLQGKNVQSPATLESQDTKIILKQSKPEVTLTFGKICLVRF